MSTVPVRRLAPKALHQLIQHRGLDACGELVASATPAQLTAVLDLDLWPQPRPGHDERFDVDRFGEWLEVLSDTGDAVAARIVAGLNPALVVAGLSRYVRVFDPGIFEPTAQSDDEVTDRHEAMHEGDSIGADGYAWRDAIEREVGGYVVRARRTDAWDAIVALLVALDTDHSDAFHAVMQGCRTLSNSMPEIGGTNDLLQAAEQHLHDVTLERERRRAEQGYATPADARAFLQMARQPRASRAGATVTVNPIVAAYFRVAEETSEPTLDRSPSSAAADSIDASDSSEPVVELLADEGMPERPRALPEAPEAAPHSSRLARVRELMAHVRDTDEADYLTRGRELAFLANVLLAGCSVQSRPFTPQEASDAAACVCNLGLERLAASGVDVFDHDLITAFEQGWSVLHNDVGLFVARELMAALDGLHSVDADIQRGLLALRRNLKQHSIDGTPWLVRDEVEVIAMLDVAAWTSLIGLLDECPIIPAAMSAILERRTTAVSQTQFEFISTRAQIAQVREFMRKLPAVLR